jgi:hypothetical protein
MRFPVTRILLPPRGLLGGRPVTKGQREPAATHQRTSWQFCPLDGVGFLIQWLNVHSLINVDLFRTDSSFFFFFFLFCFRWWRLFFFFFFFFSTLTSAARLHTTHLLGPTYT